MSVFFFNDTATTEIYTLSLHDALPISRDAMNNLAWLLFQQRKLSEAESLARKAVAQQGPDSYLVLDTRSEEHTSELQSQSNLVCRLLLEKKKNRHPAGDQS